jgi:hypothetical protein
MRTERERKSSGTYQSGTCTTRPTKLIESASVGRSWPMMVAGLRKGRGAVRAERHTGVAHQRRSPAERRRPIVALAVRRGAGEHDRQDDTNRRGARAGHQPFTRNEEDIIVTTTNKSIRRVAISLDVPTKIADVLRYANNIVQKMTNNPSFPTPTPTSLRRIPSARSSSRASPIEDAG